jgi:hypothetical protein
MKPTPPHALNGKPRPRKPGDLAALQRMLWRALRTAERILEEAEEPELQLRAIHAISQTGGQYLKLLETGEFEVRIAALEAAQKGH